MRLIKSKDTVEFLSQSAPRPWVCRMLCWMVVDGQIEAYFEKGSIQPSGSAFQFLLPHRKEAGEYSGEKMDEILKREYEPEMAEKLVGKRENDKVFDEPIVWEGEDGPFILDIGFMLFSSAIDWDAGTLRCDWIPDDRDIREIWFPTSELLYSEFEHPEYAADFSGIAFELNRIEMLLPSVSTNNLRTETHDAIKRSAHIGRPRKWDWEGALAAIIAEAQTPDGLPTGHGAQAKIETMIAEWFEASAGGSPSISQIRQRASKVIGLIQKD